MNDFDQLEEDRIVLLRWISERNRHVPVSELAYMLGIADGQEDEELDPDLLNGY